VISAENITFNYKKEPLFKDLHLNLEFGNIIGLLGKNGAGKTTLLKLITGLLAPDKGKVNVNNFIPFQRYPDFLKDIYFVSEETYQPNLSLKKYIKLYAPFYSNFDKNKMQRILEEFELKDTEKLLQISFGQKKKFMIAFALSTNCKYLILDEPTNGLDIPSKSIFRKVLVNSVDENQLVIISTHQVKDIETIIDKVVILHSGKIALNNDIYEISENFEFKHFKNIEDKKNILYYEKKIGGYKAILKNSNSSETNVDLELLFNAVVGNRNLNFNDEI
jgi:ABC-2 type transport system ATP-binding protein